MPRTCKFAFYTVRFAVFLVHLSTDTIFQKSLKKKNPSVTVSQPSSFFLVSTRKDVSGAGFEPLFIHREGHGFSNG